jgi:NADPH2:quinone reductase
VSFSLPEFFHELLRLVGIDTLKLEGEEIASVMNSIKIGFDEGRLTPSDVHELRLEEAREAYSAVGNGIPGQRQVFVFD